MVASLMGREAHALTVSVAPLKAKAEVSAFGLTIKANGEAAVVLAGKMAQEAAEIAGMTINTAKDVIVLTGSEVDEFLRNAAGVGYDVSKRVWLETKEVGEFALNVVRSAYEYHKLAVNFTYKQSKKVIKKLGKGLKKISKKGVYFISRTGERTLKTGEEVLLTVVSTPVYLACLITYPIFNFCDLDL